MKYLWAWNNIHPRLLLLVIINYHSWCGVFKQIKPVKFEIIIGYTKDPSKLSTVLHFFSPPPLPTFICSATLLVLIKSIEAPKLKLD